MKYILNITAALFITWPFVLLGYIFGAMKTGFQAGMILNDLHSEFIVEKFKKPQGEKP